MKILPGRPKWNRRTRLSPIAYAGLGTGTANAGLFVGSRYHNGQEVVFEEVATAFGLGAFTGAVDSLLGFDVTEFIGGVIGVASNIVNNANDIGCDLADGFLR